MSTMSEKVSEVLNHLNGGAPGELGRTDTDFYPGDDTLAMKDAKPNLNPGTVVSLGLHTLYVTRAVSGGAMLEVFPITAGPDMVPAGTIARFRPTQTDADVFRHLSDQIAAMSTPQAGLFVPAISESPVNYASGVYPAPTTWTVDPIRVLAVKYQDYGQDVWTDLSGWEWQPERGVVRVYGCPPQARAVQVIYALPFARPTSMADELTDLGIPQSMQDIPVLGACAYLSLGLEGRRNRPVSQGDPRRADEIPMTAGSSLGREWARQRDRRIDEEYARLMALYGPRMQDMTHG